MRYLLFILFIAIGFMAVGQEPSENFTDKAAFSEQELYREKTAFVEKSDYSNYNLTYQRMEWQIDPAERFIRGKITSYCKSNVPALAAISFDLQRNLRVDSVLYHNERLAFGQSADQLNIQLKKPFVLSSPDSLTVFYQGIPATTGSGAFVQSNHGGVPIIWTLSEPYGAMEWWPCKQSLADKIDSIDILVTCPEKYRTASNGILVSEKVGNGSRIMYWKHRYPIATYLVAIAVTNYSSYSDSLKPDNGNPVEILNFVYPESLAESKKNSPATIDVMKLYNRLFGLYPFAKEKYGHAQFGWSGGMEHQTMSFMNNLGFELIAHELAHQWFGDCITLSSWQDIWLNEGFATYLTGLSYENLSYNNYWPKWKQNQVSRIISQPGGSVFVKDTANISTLFSSRLSYSKGAYLLQMLRWIMGDADFFKAIRNYFNDPEIFNGFATQKKLVSHFENAGDTTLTEFFNDWYYGEGYPVYSIRYGQDKDFSVILKLSQKPSHNSVDFFEMPVPLRVISASGFDSIDYRLINAYSGQNFRFNPGFKVGKIKIDPDLWLISGTGTIVEIPVEKIPSEVELYPNPFKDFIRIYVPLGEKLEEIILFDSLGRIIIDESSNKTEFNFSNLPNGIYLIRIKTASGNYERKIIKR